MNRVQFKCDGTQWRTGGEVKGTLANGVGSQYSYTTSEHGASSITTADAHTSAASSRLNWRPCRFKWIRPFCRKKKSGFCACAIIFQTQPTSYVFCPFFLFRCQVSKVKVNFTLFRVLWDSEICTIAGLTAGWPRNRVSISGRDNIFSCVKRFQAGTEVHTTH